MNRPQIDRERPLRCRLRGATVRRGLAVLAAVLVALGAVASPAVADVERGDSGQEVTEVQYTLRALGYTLAVDGKFGPQTDRAVRHWQRSNGLIVDGIVGPATTASLSRATRVAPPTATAPVAGPAGLTGCEEMRWFIRNGGLPEDPFMYLGMRESGCKNDARPTIPAAACCRGWFAIHTSNIRAPGYAPGVRACGITSEADYYGLSYEQKIKSVCFAKVLWDWYVSHPGSKYPWAL